MLTIKKSLPRWLSVTFHRGVSFHPRFSPSIQGRKCIVRFRFFFSKRFFNVFTKFQFLVCEWDHDTDNHDSEWNYRCFVVWFLFFFLIFFFFLFPFWFHVHYRQTHSGCAVERIRGEDAEPGSADRAHVRDATKSACIFQ